MSRSIAPVRLARRLTAGVLLGAAVLGGGVAAYLSGAGSGTATTVQDAAGRIATDRQQFAPFSDDTAGTGGQQFSPSSGHGGDERSGSSRQGGFGSVQPPGGASGQRVGGSHSSSHGS